MRPFLKNFIIVPAKTPKISLAGFGKNPVSRKKIIFVDYFEVYALENMYTNNPSKFQKDWMKSLWVMGFEKLFLGKISQTEILSKKAEN